jgi:hypothetical protein
MDLTRSTVAELLTLYADILAELQSRKVTHSTNNPIANYSEYLAKNALSLTMLPESNCGYDGVDAAGKKYEVKGRRPTAKNGSRQLSQLRGLDKKQFDFLVGILFHENCTVYKACIIPHEVVLKHSTFKQHTNSWAFRLRDEIWMVPGVRDITSEVKIAASS